MKIGILTQPLHLNYGGIIQNWALQQVLIGMGHRPEMIFLSRGRHSRGGLLVMRCVSFVKSMVKRYLCGCKNVYLNSVFSPQYNPTVPLYADANFVRHIHKTRPLGTDDMDIGKYVASKGYDAFIIGSDQVWREEYSPSIFSFFLDFLSKTDNRLRIAYAASFGKAENYISGEKMPLCRDLLHRFDAVSVREYEGLRILERDFNYENGMKVLDPTLLLIADDYRKLIKRKDYVKKKHVASYILDSSMDKDAILTEVGLQLELPVKRFSGKSHGKKMLTVSQWLAEFESAGFVVTDSFHGCVFSIIFQKPFVAIANKERGIDRFLSLLHDTKLEKRLVYSMEEFMERKGELLVAPNYIEVEKRLALLRAMSLKFLSNALKRESNEFS